MYMVLIYDIQLSQNKDRHQEDARVLRVVFKTCKKYLSHIQKSVFEGEISRAQYETLSYELKAILRKDQDSCIVFVARNNVWMKKEFITKQIDQTSQFI